MTNIETPQVASIEPADFDDEVEDVIDVLPNELGRTWLGSLTDDPDVSELHFAFWDAARVVIEAMLRAGYTLTPPSK